jgi:hypothetical protein
VIATGNTNAISKPLRPYLLLWMVIVNTWQLHAPGELELFIGTSYMAAHLRGYELRYFPERGTTHGPDHIELLFLRRQKASGDYVRTFLMNIEQYAKTHPQKE